jgi:hypothetical protein
MALKALLEVFEPGKHLARRTHYVPVIEVPRLPIEISGFTLV